MSAKNVALKVVERAPFYRRELELPSQSEQGEAHSLHLAISYPDSFPATLAEYFVSRFSRRGDAVLDPFCGSGVSTLQAALLGRMAYGSDVNPLAVKIAASKVAPADLTEVTLRLQQANLRRPVDLQLYRQGFSAFYDIDTFREIYNLRSFLQENYDRVARFIELVCLGLLHGHSAGYFSVYTFPQVSASPEEQEQLNIKRRQSPDFRSVIPRILRKSASLLRDGFPSVLEQLERYHKFAVADARNLSHIPGASVNLVLCTPPLPGSKDYLEELWLRFWFSKVPLGPTLEQLRAPEISCLERTPAEWLEFMNESLLEIARAVKPGGRCILDLREIKVPVSQLTDESIPATAEDGRGMVSWFPDEELARVVEQDLSRFFEVEGILINSDNCSRLENCVRTRDAQGVDRRNRILILRRK